MAHASKPRSPRAATTARAKQLAAQLVTGESPWSAHARGLVTDMLVCDPKGENIMPRRGQKTGRIAVFDPLAAIKSEISETD